MPGTNPVAGWYEETRDVAERSWLYAQLSSNAYDDPAEEFILPGDVVLRVMQPNDGRGYAYAIYDRFEGQRLVETIIAYRGTEASFNDWFLGNILGAQNGSGIATATAVAAQLDRPEYENVKLSVTGHSLGGGIAHHVSLYPVDDNDSSVRRSVVFNNSPRFSGFPRDGDRLAVVERGEWLTALRYFGSEPSQIYQSVDCQPGLSPFDGHSIRNLAECLTWIAAFQEEADDARLSMAQNPLVDRPPGQVSERRPLTADTLGRGIPVNPYVSDVALARAVDASLRTSTMLSPYYAGRAGFRLIAELDDATGNAEAIWILNGVEQGRSVIECAPENFHRCADLIVQAGEGLVPRPRF
ncbi:alpha/beta hydrolase family protein [Aurantiacibacter marinus]|nr:hypothetical protein [Aurantiacibacter marinus]